MSDPVQPHKQQPTRLCCPWDSQGKNTGVGCHFLLQCMKMKNESEVTQSCPTLSNPVDCSLPGSSVNGIFQARVLEWGAIAISICMYMYVCINFASNFLLSESGRKEVNFAGYLKSNLSIFSPDIAFHIEYVSLRQLGFLHIILAIQFLLKMDAFREGPSRTEL